jgi:hypothetical protein
VREIVGARKYLGLSAIIGRNKKDAFNFGNGKDHL